MFCPECGSNITHTTGFCPNCGSKLPESQSQQSVPFESEAPEIAFAANKKEYISKVAPAPIRKKAKLGRILSIVCLALMLISYLVVMNTSLENVPIVSKALSETDGADAFDEAKDNLVDLVEELEERFEEEEDELEDMFSKKEIKNLKNFIKTAKKCAKTISVSNVTKLMKNFEKMLDTDMADHMDLNSGTLKSLEETNEVLDGVRNFLLIGALICAAFVVGGGFLRANGWVVVGLILSVIYCLLFCGVLLLLLNLAAHIALFTFNSGVNKAYKAHRRAVPAV